MKLKEFARTHMVLILQNQKKLFAGQQELIRAIKARDERACDVILSSLENALAGEIRGIQSLIGVINDDFDYRVDE